MAERWRIEFSDLQKAQWRITIEDPDFTGEYTLLKATGNPLTFSFDNSSDDVFDPIRPSRAIFEVYSLTNFVLLDIYSVEDLKFPVKIYCEGDLFWQGFVEAQNYKEVYEPVPYAVSITATDGLSVLENIIYADSIAYSNGKENITYFNGRRFESQVVLDILSEINHSGFYEFVNLYEEGMMTESVDSPFDQLKIDVDVFKDWYCIDVLREILKKYNAFIRQKDGKFYIIRPSELLNQTVYGRYFTSAQTKSLETLAPDYFIKRKSSHTQEKRLQIPGGVLMVQSPVKKVSVFQDYGNKESWLDNNKFLAKNWETFSLITGTNIKYWSKSGANNILFPLGKIVPSEAEGLYFLYKNNPPYYNQNTEEWVFDFDYYIYQEFASNAKASSSDIFNLEIDYVTKNNDPWVEISEVTFYVMVKCDTHWLHAIDEVECTWRTSETYIQIMCTAPLGVGQFTYRRVINGLPANGPYTFYIFSCTNQMDVNIGIKNVRFYATSDEILVKKRKHNGLFPKLAEWILTRNPFGKDPNARLRIVEHIDNEEITEKEHHVFNNINGIIKEYNYSLGDVVDAEMDNVIEQCAGALSLTDNSATELWKKRTEAEYKPIIELIADEIASMYSRPKQLIQMPILEANKSLQINLIANLQDDINTYNGNNRVFVINRGEFDVRNRSWELDLFEIGTKVSQSGESGSVTTDNNIITVDNNIITVDTE